MRRLSVFFTEKQLVGLRKAAAADPNGLKAAVLVRIAVNEFLARRKRQVKK